MRSLRIKLEVLAGVISAALAALTVSMPRWVEVVFGIDPDGGSGATEWAIVGGTLAVSAGLLLAAALERRRRLKLPVA